jgi:hypothetical protein
LFTDDTYIYVTETWTLCSLQVAVQPHWVELRCDRWNIEINEEKTQAVCFSSRCRVPDDVLQLNGWGIPFVNNVMYLDVTFDRRMTWRHHIKRTVAKALCTYIRTYSLFRSARLSTYIKFTL